jgi:IS30 family transposase
VAAHRGSRRRAQRPKAMKLEECPRLRQVVEDKLELWWSPAQISLLLESAYPDVEEMRVSHETNYQSLSVQRRDAGSRSTTPWCFPTESLESYWDGR